MAGVGRRPPLVLLHGVYGSWTHWIRNVLALAEHFTVVAAVKGIWGEHDSTAVPHVDARRRLLQGVQPSVDFRAVPGAGHWVMYEAPSAFNRALLSVLGAAQ